MKDETQVPSLFMSQWLCNMRVLYWKGLRSVLSSNTVHLLSHQYMEIIVPLVFGWGETGTVSVTRQIKVCLRRADLSRRLSLALVCLLCSYLLGKLVAYATLCSCMIWWQQQRPRNPRLFFSLLFHLAPSHLYYFFDLIRLPISALPPPVHHPFCDFKQLLVFVEA